MAEVDNRIRWDLHERKIREYVKLDILDVLKQIGDAYVEREEYDKLRQFESLLNNILESMN